jgi:RNA polymerase primary sigma factor
MSASTARHALRTDSLTTYLEDIGTYRMLSRNEEIALAQRIRDGDANALEQLVCANLRFVVSVAKKYQTRGVPLADLVNEGNLGLMHAAERFDETKGVKFISYAVWWIRQAIIHALAEQGHAVRVPLNRAGMLFRLRRRAEDLRRELGREPTQRELAEASALSERELADATPLTRAPLSLDAPLGDGDDSSILDHLADDHAPAPDDDAMDVTRARVVDNALRQLRPRESTVVRLYFGFDGCDPMTLEAIGERLGVTRERVRHLRDRALSRLRKSASAHALATFAER